MNPHFLIALAAVTFVSRGMIAGAADDTYKQLFERERIRVEQLMEEVLLLKQEVAKLKDTAKRSGVDKSNGQRSQTIDGLGKLIVVEALQKDDYVEVKFTITPEADSEISLYLSRHAATGVECSAVDQKGKELLPIKAVIAGNSSGSHRLLRGVTVDGSIEFAGLSKSSNKLAAIRIEGFANGKTFRLLLRDIALVIAP